MQKMENVKEKLKCTTIFISAAWQQMYQANQALTTSVNIIMTMQQTVLFIHVLIEYIFKTLFLFAILNLFITLQMYNYYSFYQYIAMYSCNVIICVI